MKLKKDFKLCRVLDETIVIPTGEVSKSFYGMVKLNESAADIWSWIEEGADEAALTEKLADKYELSCEKATADVKAFISQMTEAGLLEV